MNARELVSDLPLGPGDSRLALLQARLLISYLADHVYIAEMDNGAAIRDATDFVKWLRELVDAANCALSRSRLTATRRAIQDTCPRCGHVHQGDAECGEQTGGGRICRCEFEGVPA